MMVSVMIGMLAFLNDNSLFGQQDSAGKEKAQTSPAQTAPAQPKAATPDKTASPSLEEMLTRALKDNPDIRVAEAKVREADAELNRTRLLVTQKVIAFHRALEAQKAVVSLGEKELKRFQDLAAKNAISRELLDERQQKLTVAKAKLAEVEAEMPYLLGKPPQPVSPYVSMDYWRMAQPAWGNDAYWVGHALPSNVWASPNELTFLQPFYYQDFKNAARVWDINAPTPARPPAPGSMAEKIRKALDSPITLNVAQQPLGNVLADIEKLAAGLTFRIGEYKDRPLANLPVANLRVQELPAVAVLQALEDTFPGLTFVVREYGILVTWNEKLPPGALRVETFWKAGKEKPKAAEGDSAKKNPPLEDVRGKVLDVDATSGLVSISLGRDAGIQVGNTLEVYRLEPKPEYLGTIRVVDVKSNQAVAKPVTPQGGKQLQKGDRVASRVNAR
jgi:hypothetical protein